MADVFSVVASTPAVQSLRRRLEEGVVLSLEYVTPGAQPFFAGLLAHLFPERTIVVVTDSLHAQEVFQQDIETWIGETKFFPSWEILPHESRLPHADVISERLGTLIALSQGRAKIVIASAVGLLEKTFPLEELKRRTRELKRGDSMDPMDLIEWLEDQSYDAEVQVTERGHVSMRGGIVDFWPLTSPWPVRLEFFGNYLESLRYFDPATQISREEIQAITVPPGGELGLLRKEKSPVTASLLDYVPANAIFLLAEPEMIEAQAEAYRLQAQADDPFLLTWKQFQEEMGRRKFPVLTVSQIENVFLEDVVVDGVKLESTDALNFQGLDLFRPIGEKRPEPHIVEAQRKEFFNQLHRWTRQNYRVQLFCDNDGEQQRFEELWWEYGLGRPEGLEMRTGAISRGFLFEPAKLVVVTDAEIFGRYKAQRPRRLKSPHAALSRSLLDINFAELAEGDYVVHLQHGIGRYLGLGVMPAPKGRPLSPDRPAPVASSEECMIIQYAASGPEEGAPKLYVPVSEAHLVSKYIGAGKVRPPLHTLGGTRWAKTKEHTETAVRDVAADMLAVQAGRALQPGHAFLADTPWQHEFENSFVYEETPDQWRAIKAAKADMEAPKPMDRLVCGDVGYGKTEVAIRAAFKAALGGKQVAVLVPTTVLAQQHFNTFSERMAEYPVRVELLSRFRTKREIGKTIEGLADGSVDIVIGTHRLLQKDIDFKDLGLVVIDEEQRFGVMHKERFKQLRMMVDVLTLTATPIPRTLHLALAGARDMSTIETPPQDRLPVETIVSQYDERLIRDAIQRELNRGGQVFYLYNRVLDIEVVAQRLRGLVPNARIAVGHGQMHSDQLEEVMTTFINGETDVLLSTTIIESGLDIPNANTIIIDRADRFGLSDLYQLRGRVGRYKHQAYAYLLLPRHAGLLTDARKRISAIKQYSSLGSGFKIAMRDLEIRGAGNLLGAEQSGHITAVGFELYCQLLRKSIQSLKGEKTAPRVETQVRLDFIALNPDAAAHTEISATARAIASLPASYIPEAQQRIEIHRKLAQIADAEGLRQLKSELRDRFGPLPEAVELLLKVADLKIAAAARGISIIEHKEEKLMLTRNNDFVMAGGKFPRLRKTTASARLNEIKKLVIAV